MLTTLLTDLLDLLLELIEAHYTPPTCSGTGINHDTLCLVFNWLVSYLR